MEEAAQVCLAQRTSRFGSGLIELSKSLHRCVTSHQSDLAGRDQHKLRAVGPFDVDVSHVQARSMSMLDVMLARSQRCFTARPVLVFRIFSPSQPPRIAPMHNPHQPHPRL